MTALLHDLRAAAQSSVRTPGLALAVVATLTLGIGANTAIFSVVRGVLLRNLPYADPARVVVVWNPQADVREDTWLSAREVMEFQRTAASYERFSAFALRDATLTGGDEPERVRAAAVTTNTFETLGVAPLFGRTFTSADDITGEAAAAIIGEGVWRRRFGADPGVLGRPLRVDGQVRTLVGVMPQSFKLPLDYRAQRPSEIWLPLVFDPARLGGWGNRSLYGVARLRSGVAASAATAELAVLWRQWVEAGNVQNDREQPISRAAVPVQNLVVGGLRPALTLQSVVVAIVLLIACVNASNLLLARLESRRTEMATRVALGASRGRILRQMLVEGLVVSAAGGLAGVAVAAAGVRFLTWLRPAAIPRVEEIALDVPVLAFSLVLCVACGTLVGLPAALAALRRDTAQALRASRSTDSPAAQQTRRVLVVAEIGLAVALLVAAGLLVRSFVALRGVDLGYRTAGVMTFGLALPASDYPDAAAVSRFYDRVVQAIAELPAVQHAAAVRRLPLSSTIGDWSIAIEGRAQVAGDNPNGDWQVVTPDYFAALGIRASHGRVLHADDRADAPFVAVVNDTMAAKYWGGREAIGKRFRLGTNNQPWITIIGIVPTGRHNTLLEAPRAEMLLPLSQFAPAGGSITRVMTVVVRTAGDPAALAAPIRQAIRTLDPRLAVADLRTFDDVIATALAPARFAAVLVALFAVLAAGLATIGIAGLVTFDVSRRHREIGVRLALGGAPGQIVRRLTFRAGRLAAAGIALGVGAALIFAPLMRSQLVGVGPADALTLAGAAAAMAIVVVAATHLAARRAARVDPLVALRAD